MQKINIEVNMRFSYNNRYLRKVKIIRFAELREQLAAEQFVGVSWGQKTF